MNRLKQYYNRPLHLVPLKWAVIFGLVALIGFADASYLTIEHYRNVIPPCSVTGGCEVVLTSEFSTIGGLPISLVGAIYYLLILVGTLIYIESKNLEYFKNALWLTVVGFLTSVFLFYVQAAILHAFCAYCLGSAATSTVLFILAAIIWKKYTNNVQNI